MTNDTQQKSNQTNSWQHTQNEAYLNLIKQRIASVNLTWVEQLIEYFKSESDNHNTKSLKDIGCQTFQVYKQLKANSFNTRYYGYELDQQYVQIGLEFFPELRENIVIGDFNLVSDPITTDWSVCSSTLEHIDDWHRCLEKILSTTKDTAYIRTFLGNETKRTECRQYGASDGYPVWQFSFEDLLSSIKRLGFKPFIEIDSFTRSLPRLLDIDPDGVVRQTYVVIAKRSS